MNTISGDSMSMDVSKFYVDVQETAALGTVDAARAVSRAVLTTLGERITIGEAEAVGEYLPDELATQLTTVDDDADDFSADEFIARVSDRTILDNNNPEHVTRAVFAVLSDHVQADEFDNLTDQLPASYSELLQDAEIDNGASSPI
jgi:uncharacterized protein (DUF2267 family)